MKKNYSGKFFKFSFHYIGCILFLICCSLLQPANAQDYQLVFADEFDGTEVNTDNWTFLIGDGTSVGLPPGWGNNELQYYREENTTVAGGLMTITAKEEFFSGYNYTSSRLITENKQDFTYGRMEMRAKMPIGQGLWPAFWMFFTQPGEYGGWAASGEIDIMEYIGSIPDEVFGTIHFGQPFPGNVFSSVEYTLPSGNFNDDFHVFTIEWEPGEIRWYVDDILYATQNNWWSNGGNYPAPFDQPFHLLLNLAVGGNLPGNPDATTVFPQEYVIDYVRVYEDQDLPTVAINSPADDATFAAGDDINISASPNAPLGLAKVEYFQGDLKLGETTAAPHEFTVANAAAGTYRLRAVVTDNIGKKNYSDFVDIVVGGAAQGPYAMLPTAFPGCLEVENYDTGGQGEAYNDTDPSLNEGSKAAGNLYRSHEGPDLEPTTDLGGGQNLGFTVNGEWLEYTVDIAAAGEYDILARVASQSNTGSFSLLFDGVDKTGPISFEATGGSQTWVDISKENVSLDAGVQVMRLQILANGFNINNICINPADPSSGTKVTFDDMEHGDPFNNGWFAFGGSVGGGGLDANSSDLPPLNGGAFSLQTGWGSGGTPGFFGGFGRNHMVDISQTDYFNMWINPDAGQDYVLEINIQDDDNDDGTQDDEFQYNLEVSATGPGAISGGGWQLVSIPLADFADDNSVLNGGNGILDDKILTIVLAVISNSGADVTFRTDFWSFTKGPLGPEISIDPESHDFGEIAVGGSGAKVFTIKNEGCTELDVTSTSIGGADAALYTIANGAAPFTVGPGAEHTVLLRFEPVELGATTASLDIESSDADESTLSIALSGTGVEAPDILKVVFDDMEHGDPLSSGYFTFGGLASPSIGGTSADLPPENSGAFALEASLSSGGDPGFFGGFGRTFPVDLSEMTHFNFWINPDAGQDYVIEIQLQDDDNGDDEVPFGSPDDDEWQFNFNVSASGNAISGGGWQLISLPLSDFFDDGTFFGGNGILDPFSVDMGGNGQLINVIFGLISNSGADITFRTDLWCFSKGPLGVTDPEIGVTPNPYNYGLLIPGTSTQQTFEIANLGGAPLEISSVTLAGEDVDDFNIVSGGDPITVDVGGTTDIVVSFSPSSNGVKSAVLQIASNDPNQATLDVGLSGEGSDVNKVVFDDMEHGNPFANGWFTFNGNGGGGIDPNSEDLPPANSGVFSLQTGWGGGGNPGFYGGFGRTNPVDTPEMTHFNFWINPNADQDYTLEINLQDDDNNDGNPDDEFQYNLVVSPSSTEATSGGGWQLVSIPLSDFFDDNSFLNGGNGVLDDRIINIVIAVISNSGADVNFRTDFWCFSEGPVKAKLAFDDMEHGDPLGNGWFTFNGNGGGGVDPNFSDLPPQNGGDASLQTGWGSGGNPGFFGGFGRNNPVHIADMTHFNLWINPDAGQDYLLEINLQEDDNGDNAFPFPAPDDDEWQYNLQISPAGTEVISGGGWQLVSIPLANFFDDNSIHGGNGIFDPVPVGSGGNGQLISIVIAVISNSGADVTFRTDFWCFSDGPLELECDPELIVDAGEEQSVYLGYAPTETVSLTASVTGGEAPYTYLWSNGETTESITVSPTETTVYEVVITDANGCEAMDQVTVNVVDVRCGNGKVLVCHKDKNTLCISANAVPAHLAHGDTLGSCEGTTGGNKGVNNISLKLYPNPVVTELKLSMTEEKEEVKRLSIQVYDIQGRLIQSYDTVEISGDGEFKIPTSTFTGGIYFMTINGNNGTVERKTFIVNK
ncbi:MAG: choice-of-anchor D domain-containing protein [Flavobacteriaceae bacterium]